VQILSIQPKFLCIFPITITQIRSIFITLDSSLVLFQLPCPDFFHHSFICSWISHKWNNRINLLCLVSFVQQNTCWDSSMFFCVNSSFPLNCIICHLTILQIVFPVFCWWAIWIVSRFWLLWIKLLCLLV
jgi:hypothetical protein